MDNFNKTMNEAIKSVFSEIALLSDVDFNDELASFRDNERTNAIYYALTHDDFWTNNIFLPGSGCLKFGCTINYESVQITSVSDNSFLQISSTIGILSSAEEWAKLIPIFCLSNSSKSFEKLDERRYGKFVASDDYSFEAAA